MDKKSGQEHSYTTKDIGFPFVDKDQTGESFSSELRLMLLIAKKTFWLRSQVL